MPALLFRKLLATSLAFATAGCVRRADGSLLYGGERPEDGQWHGHGYFARKLWVLREKGLEQIRLWKHRWRLVGTNTTCHSRPFEELPTFGASLGIVFLVIFEWLDSGKGLSHRDRRSVLSDVEERCASRRTEQRWLHRYVPDALSIQQAIRRAVIERCEPRPVETLFRGGLPPPDGLERRGWKDPPSVLALWRAFAILFIGALVLDVPVSLLLTEARGRWSDPKTESSF
jgi:hypothetical protein